MNRTRHFIFALCSLIFASFAQAQLELKSGNFNNIFVAQTAAGADADPSGPPVVTDPETTTKQFSAMGQVAGASGPISDTSAHVDRYPSNPEKTLILVRATIGGVFTSGVPRYSLGDEITPPSTETDGITLASSNYWRAQPVLPGETFQIGGSNQTLFPLGSVNVTDAATNSTLVTVETPLPPSLVVGSTMLGQPVTVILGSNVTLAGNANASVSGSTPIPITPATSFYYSPHAEKAFASQAGRVTVTWITRSPDGSGNYLTKPEDFAVSTNTKRPVRTIFWSEGAFDGPKVQITDNRITTVNPAYYNLVPKAVAQEVTIPGYNPLAPNLTTLSFDKFSGIGELHAYNVEGRIFIEYLGDVRLGNDIYEFIGSDVVELVRVPTANYVTVHLGQEITPHEPSVSLSPPASGGTTARATATVSNGKVTGLSIIDGGSGYGNTPPVVSFTTPDNGTTATAVATVTHGVVTALTVTEGGDGYPELTASPVLSSVQNATNFYAENLRQDSTSAYFAERETSAANSPDNGAPASQDAYNKVIFYWLEEGEFSIKWPQFQDRYWLRWSPNLNDYAHYSVDPTGGAPDTGVPFTNGSLPAIIYQDDPAQSEAQIDLATQRLYVNFAADSDQKNRSLLKFSSSESSWYVNLYTQAENREVGLVSTIQDGILTVASTAGLEVGMVVTGLSITGSAVITRIIDSDSLVISQTLPNNTYALTYSVQSDTAAPIHAAATVGTRLVQPAGHENAGYISSGTSYYPAGYLNPFVVGVTAANEGAIIPVNAHPDDNQLTVRWFKKITAPSAAFQDLYVPGKIGRYTVSYPASTNPQIVIAKGTGTGDLSAVQAAGEIYYQNDPALPGYNPNEEHALSFAPRVYALRDDLNSKYFTLSAYGWQNFLQVDDTSILSVGMTVIMPGDAGIATVVEILNEFQLEVSQPVPGDGDYIFTTGDSTGEYTSEPFVLIAYSDPVDERPAMQAYKVVREDETYDFDYTATAGTALRLPYPLELMPLPLVGSGASLTSKNLEIIGADAPANTTLAENPAYKGFTFKDRKGLTWVHRGPHDAGEPSLSMKLYYLSREGFFIPGVGESAVGTVLPFLRDASRSGKTLNINSINANADGTPGQIDEPLTVVYRPTWPTGAPELRVGETLTLPKFGLPQVLGQTSAQVYYQQSLAKAATGLTENSVTLHDPTREKTVEIDAAGVNLAKLPDAIKTTSYQGKTYFQGLPPQLQSRLYLDPLRGSKGTLVFIGEFHDEIAGEDYLDLNLLTATEETLVKDLVPVGATGKSSWDAAIDALNTRVETFKNDPAQFGSYVVESFADVGENELSAIDNPNTAVDNYAVTATGQGTGYVTMVFGNGLPKFTAEGDPVQVQVFKIAEQLYVGDLKVLMSSNPLDEQVTLRHSGDFAGKPGDYEFDWRWTNGDASAPSIYTTSLTTRIGYPLTSSQNWLVVSDPGSLLPSADQYTDAGAALKFRKTENVRPVNYVLDAQNQPTATVIDASSYTDAEIAAGYPGLVIKSTVGVDFTTGGVPANIVFSADLGTADGFVVYVNGRASLAYNAPEPRFTLTNASSGLSDNGLPKQFTIAPSYFTAGLNTIEVAIYTTADPNTQSSLNFMLEADDETDVVTSGGVWSPPDTSGINTNTAIVGGSATLPFGGPDFVLNDRWFTVRYRPKASANNVLGTPYSRWMEPQFVEGWIKRVLAAINPFEQRMKDLENNEINSDVSVITQAGKRWEGDIALNLENINDAGLIEIYETVLNRGKNLSINANTNDADTNNALVLAAGYLNDLYTILGNEAYADAANPTISIDDSDSATEVNTSRFSFESQVTSSLEEELALLRGRDDSVSPKARTAPAYNRLYWNYTRGINSGEVIYAVNYNVKEKVGSSTADGVIDEEDAQRMFPQGHGDAYGHYLTALTGYYQLLTNANFDWTPRAEAVTVLDQDVTVDYLDERKFAAAAGNVARTAQQVAALTFRQSYKDDPAAGWASFRDDTGENTDTGVTRRQGLDEWVSRGTQGAFFHWAVANAMLPDEDNVNTGVQKIDRTTVPEIPQLATAAASFQTTIDNANAHLNPLGLSPGAIAFDLDPTAMKEGQSHYEQISGRALVSLNNAKGSFDQAAIMTRSLRNQQNQIDDYAATIAQQESAYVSHLLDIYGKPYSGDIGPGKLYAQGYTGPDLEHWYIADRPNDLVNTGKAFSVSISEADQIAYFTDDKLADIKTGLVYYDTVDGVRVPKPATYTQKTVTVQPSQWVQYNDVWKAGGLGSRAETGELQDALQDAQQSLLAISEANVRYQKTNAQLTHAQAMLQDLIQNHIDQAEATSAAKEGIAAARGVAATLTALADNKVIITDGILKAGNALAEAFPKLVGFSNDVTSTGRSAALFSSKALSTAVQIAGGVAKAGAAASELSAKVQESELTTKLRDLGFKTAEVQMAYEAENLYRETITRANELMQLTITHQRALQNVNNVLAKGARILAEREVFRQRAAAIVQGYRTKDLAFRLFRNEALEQYRSLFDLASRYSYLAAKSYDYETGLLGTPQGQQVFDKIVASRSLGDLTGGVPQSTTSTLGDAGLAGTMAQLNADFSVAEGRLGINNPDQYGTLFSLRGELFRLLNDPAITSDDDAWQQTIEQHIVDDVMTDADVATHCRNIRKPDGTPVPGIVIPFTTSIEHSKNFFGLPLAAGDHAYTPSNFATKIYSVGIALPGYVGMDSYADGDQNGAPASGDANALSASPYAYLIPCGADYMLAPPLGDTNILRAWNVKDQALPLPYNLGASDFNETQFFSANGTLTEQPWILRKHQAFRMIDDPTLFYSRVPAEFTNSRLIGRSVWNGQWKIVIPAYTLLNDEYDGLNKFADSVEDIQLFLRTYSNSGN